MAALVFSSDMQLVAFVESGKRNDCSAMVSWTCLCRGINIMLVRVYTADNGIGSAGCERNCDWNLQSIVIKLVYNHDDK